MTEVQVTAADAETSLPVHDCWNRIGVSGNGSCRELLCFVHCRNCPVYSAAAVQLLDRPVTEAHRREWTEHFGKARELTTPARISVVIFRLGDEWLALPTAAFQEVAERRRLHSLPHRRGGAVLGLVNVRGELLVCASLERVLGLAYQTTHAPSRTVYDRLLVAVWDGKRLVFPVAEVHGIQRVHEAALHEPPATVAKATQRCSRGVFAWRDRTVGLLDADILFSTLNRNLA